MNKEQDEEAKMIETENMLTDAKRDEKRSVAELNDDEEDENEQEEKLDSQIKDNSAVDLRKVYQDRLEEFLHPAVASRVEEKVSKNNAESVNEDEDDEAELDLNSRRNKLKLREEMAKDENEVEALSEREEDQDEQDENEEVRRHICLLLSKFNSYQTLSHHIYINFIFSALLFKIVVKRIEEICLYLRAAYCYCVWCGFAYDNELELSANCPGPSERDHDDE